jgi:ketosteroid isomerase-like protein
MVSGLDWDLGDAVDPAFGAAFAAALAQDDLADFRTLLAPEGSWHISGSGPHAGTHQGPDSVIALIEALRALGLTFSIFDNLVSDAHLGLLLTLDRTVTGEKQSAYSMWLIHVDDGLVSECFWYFEDQAAFEALVAAT